MHILYYTRKWISHQQMQLKLFLKIIKLKKVMNIINEKSASIVTERVFLANFRRPDKISFYETHLYFSWQKRLCSDYSKLSVLDILT